MKHRRIFITPSNAEFYACVKEDAASAEATTNWTISKHARRGDLMLLYICAPVSAIVASAMLSDDPELEENPRAEFFGHHLADMIDVRLLREPITRAEMMSLFPEWRYMRQPRNSVAAPDGLIPELEALLRERGGID